MAYSVLKTCWGSQIPKLLEMYCKLGGNVVVGSIAICSCPSLAVCILWSTSANPIPFLKITNSLPQWFRILNIPPSPSS